jgi:hypothetical protein
MSAIDGVFTVNDVIVSALRRSGIIGPGQVAAGDDVIDAQNELSYLLAQWNTKTWLVWDKVDVSVVSTGQVTPYTIGPANVFSATNPVNIEPSTIPTTTVSGTTVATNAQIVVTQRPDRVEAAYIRILGGQPAGGFGGQPVDQPLEMIPAAESYADIALKQLVAFTKAWYYQPESPVGSIFFYPWPQASLYEMHVIIKNAFPLILPLNTVLTNLAPVARAAMIYNLARRLRQAYGKGLRPDPELSALAKDSLETMRMSQVMAPQLTMPPLLRRPSHYNIYGDITY